MQQSVGEGIQNHRAEVGGKGEKEKASEVFTVDDHLDALYLRRQL